MQTTPKPHVHRLYDNPLSPDEIEQRSFDTIEKLVAKRPENLDEWHLIRRLIHTTGDPGIASMFCSQCQAISAGQKALSRGARIVVDAQMIRAGLSLSRLRGACPNYQKSDIICHIADADVAAIARDQKLPRSLFALRKAQPNLDCAIAVFGNAPVALLELNRLVIEEGLRPALVVGFPVGFIHVEEAKAELATLDVPAIILRGNRGGSPLAVAAIHALCKMVEDKREGEK